MLEPSLPRVVHVITGLGTGGAEHSLASLVAGQRGRYDSVVVSLLEGGPVAARIESLGIPVHSIGMNRGRVAPLDILRLSRLLRQLQPDLLQSWMYHANLAAWAAKAVARAHCALAWNVRHTPGDLRQEKLLTRSVIRWSGLVSRAPRAIVYNSWTSARRHERLGYARERRHVIPNGFDTTRLRPCAVTRARIRQELRLDDSSVLVGLIARFHPVKDHASFLRAARAVASWSPDVRFVLVGTGVDRSNRELMGVIEDLALGEHVLLLGERRDVPDLMTALDVVCLASRGEGFPNVVGEAMACGVPCVVTDVGDAARIVDETGIVVPPKDSGALARGLREMVDLEPKMRRRRGAAARQRIVEAFSLDRMLDRYDALYSGLLGGRSDRGARGV